jgi:hypothetical protein
VFFKNFVCKVSGFHGQQFAANNNSKPEQLVNRTAYLPSKRCFGYEVVFMHWLLLLALLSSTGDLKNVGNSNDALSRAAEASLRRQIGPMRSLRVDAARKSSRQPGDFEHFNVTLDGASLDNLLALANQAETKRLQRLQGVQSRQNSLSGKNNFDLGDILGGDFGGDLGGIFGGDLGDILGGVLGGQNGRIGSVKLNLTNFTLQGVGYDRLDADIGEIRFDFVKALQGDFDIKSWQPGNLRLQLRADQASRLITPRLPSIKDPYLRFDGGRAWVGGKANLYGVNVPFQAGGMLSVQSNQVRAENLALSVANLRLPNFIVDELTKGVNPLYDFDPQKRWRARRCAFFSRRLAVGWLQSQYDK